MSRWENEIVKAASILSVSTNTVVMSGAGVSAESNIPTFRDAGGLWDRMDPVEAGTADNLFAQLEQNAGKLKPILNDLLDAFGKAEPNPGHTALFDLEKMGILKTVITQNIDNLHREAGNTDIIEMHGNMFQMRCLDCGHKEILDRKSYVSDIEEKLKNITRLDFSAIVSLALHCESCSSIMRPDVVMFGEEVQGMPESFQAAEDSDSMLVLGTSGVVYPAAYLPFEAKKAGAGIIVINPKENSFGQITDVYLPMKTGEALPAIVQEIKNQTGTSLTP